MLSTALTAVLKLVVEEMAPLKELLICESDVLWVTLVEVTLLKEVLTPVLRLTVSECAIDCTREVLAVTRNVVAIPAARTWPRSRSSTGPCLEPRRRPRM